MNEAPLLEDPRVSPDGNSPLPQAWLRAGGGVQTAPKCHMAGGEAEAPREEEVMANERCHTIGRGTRCSLMVDREVLGC